MDDEQLSTLLVTRGDSLVEEARSALDTEIARRDPAAFKAEVQAKVVDVEAQASEARTRAREAARVRRQTRIGIWIFGGLFVLLGAVVALAGRNGGGVFAGLGAGLVMWYEIWRLKIAVVRAMFRQDGPLR